MFQKFTVSATLLGFLLMPLATTAGVKTAFLFQPVKALAQEGEEDLGPQDCVPLQELQGETQMRNDQLGELKRLLKVKNAPIAELEQLKTINATVQKQQQTLKELKGKRCIERDLLDELREENFWDQINSIRRRIELPRELKQISKDLRELEKISNRKALAKLFPELGGNLETLKTQIAQRKDIVAQVTAALAKGGEAEEDVDELMQTFWEGGHPGEILGVLHGMTDEFGRGWRQLPDDEIREAIKAIIAPITTAINEGEWRDARELAQEIGPVLERIMRKVGSALRSKRGRSDVMKRLEELEQKLEAKFGKEEEKSEPNEGGNE